MALQKLQDDLNIIASLGDNPGADDNLTPQEFKAMFDKAARIIQDYINGVLAPAIDAVTGEGGRVENLDCGGQRIINLGSPKEKTDGANREFVETHLHALAYGGTGARDAAGARKNLGAVHKAEVAANLPVGGWANKTITVTVAGVTYDNTVIIGPAPESFDAWMDAEVRCTAQGTNSLTFRCTNPPTGNVTANVVILT